MRKNRFFYLLGVALLAIVGVALLLPTVRVSAQPTGNAPAATGALLQDEQNTVEIVQNWGDSVVAINVEVRGTRVSPFGDLLPNLPPQFRQLLPDSTVPQIQQSSGSGFVIDDNAIITNYHVVKDALETGSVELLPSASLRVVFADSDEELDARVVGADPDYDLALLELVDPAGFPAGVKALELADSTTAQVGQKVIAIGNPFGLQSSVSQGIISAIGRDLASIGRVQIPMIQTDAAINPGNSGGPLLDSAGRLLGVNTMIVPGMTAYGRGANIGIGFAVPSQLLREALPEMRGGGLVGVYAASLDIENRPRIGVTIVALDAFPNQVRKILDLPDHGLMITTVAENSPAADAGLEGPSYQAQVDGAQYPAGGDIILSANGKRLEQAADLQRLLIDAKEGDAIDLELWRNGTTREVTVTLRVVPVEEPVSQP